MSRCVGKARPEVIVWARPGVHILAWAVLAVLPGLPEGARDWSCARDDPTWHFRREAVRYIMHDEGSPIRTSMKRMKGLVWLWQSVDSRSRHLSALRPDLPCVVGEVFFMLLDVVMADMPKAERVNTFNVDHLANVLRFMSARISFAGALRSTWPIYGLLAVAQQGFLQLGDDGGPSPLQAMAGFTSVCAAGAPLAREMRAWLAASAPGPALAPLLRAARAAGRLRIRFAHEGACAADSAAMAAARLVSVLGGPRVNATLPAGGIDDHIDGALQAGFLALFFSGWPVFAVLHRIQEAYLKDAHCSEAEPGAYALRTRATPDSHWMCVRRSQDLVDERWRMQGVFNDCVYISHAMWGEARSDCLFLDVGANLGACALAVAKLGIDVLAFEPLPAANRLLRAAVGRNGLGARISVFEQALGKDADAVGSLSCTEGHSATCHFVAQGASGHSPTAGAPVAVPATSLDAVVRAHAGSRRVCGIKVDVEGAEEEVLLGAASTLSSWSPPLFLELHPLDLYLRGSSPEKVFDTLVGYGYRSFVPLAEDTPPACAAGGLRGNGTYPGEHWHRASPVRTITGIYDPCTCSFVCYQMIAAGCRCWDYDGATRLCKLWRLCVGHKPKPGSDAGELNGIWRIAAR